jgi:hypothetical protein
MHSDLYNLNRNKAFFFYAMEWRSQRQGDLLETVPAGNEFAGNFGTITIMVTA